MKAVVMAGGEGTRLRPLTSNRPKPLVPILNKPIAQHIIEHLKRAGITDIVVTLYYLAEEIQNYFGDGSDLGVNLIYSIEDTPLGTAGSVKKAEAFLNDDTFVIVSGDALTDLNIEKAVSYHRQKKSEATLILQSVPNPLEFGVVMTHSDGRIQRFLEKPSWGEVFSDTVNTGMYVLEPSVFNLMEQGKSYDWSQDIFPQLLEAQRPLYGYTMEEYWTDVGSHDQYRQAQYEMLNGLTQLPIEGDRRDGNVYIGTGTEIEPGAMLKGPCFVGTNCRIKAGVVIEPDTVIGDNAILEEGACIEKAILWDSAYVGRGAQLNACVVCNHVTIKDSVRIEEGAVVGDRCHIEEGAVIRGLVKLWPDKVIETNAQVTDSLIWGAKYNAGLFRTLGVTGIANIELTPEYAAKLGASYGAFLKKGATVVMGRDGHPASRMLKRAMLAGLVSVGCDVLDVEAVPLPILRFGVKANNAQGGINIRVDPNFPRNALIEFFDKQGIYLTKNAERKIESIFYREDYGRTDMEEVGKIEFAPRTAEMYRNDFFNHLHTRDIERRRFRIVVDYAYGRLSTILPELLGQLGCDVIALNAYPDWVRSPKTPGERQVLLSNLSQVVQTLRADLGVLLHSDGERMNLVDEKGDVLEGSRQVATVASLVAQTRPGAKVAVPVTAPSIIETVMRRTNGVVSRTKTDSRFLMALASLPVEKVAMGADLEGGFLFPDFQPAFDAMFSFAKTMEMLAWLQRPLSEFAAELPPVHVAEASVRCPWDAKGKVMRLLTEESGKMGGRTELLDGIKMTESEARMGFGAARFRRTPLSHLRRGTERRLRAGQGKVLRGQDRCANELARRPNRTLLSGGVRLGGEMAEVIFVSRLQQQRRFLRGEGRLSGDGIQFVPENPVTPDNPLPNLCLVAGTVQIRVHTQRQDIQTKPVVWQCNARFAQPLARLIQTVHKRRPCRLRRVDHRVARQRRGEEKTGKEIPKRSGMSEAVRRAGDGNRAGREPLAQIRKRVELRRVCVVQSGEDPGLQQFGDSVHALGSGRTVCMPAVFQSAGEFISGLRNIGGRHQKAGRIRVAVQGELCGKIPRRHLGADQQRGHSLLIRVQRRRVEKPDVFS